MATQDYIIAHEYGATPTVYKVHVKLSNRDITGGTDAQGNPVTDGVTEAKVGYSALSGEDALIPVMSLQDALKNKVLKRLYVRGKTVIGNRPTSQEILVKNDTTLIKALIADLVKPASPVTFRGMKVSSVSDTTGKRVSNN